MLSLDLLKEVKTSESQKVLDYFNNSFFSLNDETLRGVQSTIAGYLSYFTSPEIAEVFCSEELSNFHFSDLDKGKMVTVALPQ